MAPVRVRLALLVGALAPVAACAGETPTPVIESISPAQGYSDRDVRLFIRGWGFVPTFAIDPAAGARRGEASGFSGHVGVPGASVALHHFGWRSVDELSAWMDQGLPPGSHPVEITDPRGQTAVFAGGFRALGPDRVAPAVEIERPTPDTPVAPGMTLQAIASASDAAPGQLGAVRWEVRAAGLPLDGGACPLTPDASSVRCHFEVAVPPFLGADVLLEIVVIAVDEAAIPNRSERARSFRLRTRPAVVAVSPDRGGIGGGNDVLVKGTGFLPGSTVLVDDVPLAPGGGVFIDDETIGGRMPPHAPGAARIVVRTPVGNPSLDEGFRYEEPPRILSITPATGAPGGGTLVHIRGRGFAPSTLIYFGAALGSAAPLAAAQYLNDAEMSGYAPPGRGRTSVWALDPALGWTRLADAFAWSAP